MELPSCQGITKANTLCSRTANLDADGFCYQHKHQRQVVGEDQDQASSSVQEEHASVSQHDNNAPAPVVAPASPSSEEAQPLRQALPQCLAISRSTNARCRHLVSFLTETNCPSHGGRQKAPLGPVMARCVAIAKHTRLQCSKHVSVAGETFCPAHGGLTKGSQRVVHMSPSPPRGNALPHLDASVPWHTICSTVLKYVILEHPTKCAGGGGVRCCQTMQTIRVLLSTFGSKEDDGHSEELNDSATVTAWATKLSDTGQLTPQSVWLLGLYQVVNMSRLAPIAAAAAAGGGGGKSPSPLYRMPSDLDSFLHDFVPHHLSNHRNAAIPPPSPPVAAPPM